MRLTIRKVMLWMFLFIAVVGFLKFNLYAAVVFFYKEKPYITIKVTNQSSNTSGQEHEGRQAVWKWSCEDDICKKEPIAAADENPTLSLESCKMFCNKYGLLWPRPTGNVDLGNFLSKINIDNMMISLSKTGKADELMSGAINRFKHIIQSVVPKDVNPKKTGKALHIYIEIEDADYREFSLNMDESYRLRVAPSSEDRVNATIFADTFFGIRHGLETLSQLFIYDDTRNHVLFVRDVEIDDKPVYPYRGILLDTARNYYSIDSIMRTIDAMAAVKLNTFHWHITDSHSFPFVSDKRPFLTKYGALSPRKVYTKESIRRIVKYGAERGVRVLPEFDAPAHVGEGWQNTNLTVCFKAEPWKLYCVEPPCGQLDPTKDELYNVLEDIYTEMAEVFQSDLFHMGGDEVNENCWMSSKTVQEFVEQNKWQTDHKNFLKVWDYFQRKAQDRVYKAFGNRIPLIVWTSTLTEFNSDHKYLNPDDYIIQVWTTGIDVQVKRLLQAGYKIIMSNYDALYLDCGFSAWVGAGNNWCSPYIGWQKVYNNSFADLEKNHQGQILGGEAALWSEQSDASSLDNRLWPRAAALAERLWSNPSQSWTEAEYRMLHIRNHLVNLGVNADAIEPEWCYQNEGYCYA